MMSNKVLDNNLGISYRNHGALDNALEYYIKSLQIYVTIDNKEGIATSKNNIGNVYSNFIISVG
ncbi:MAG: tetratricopeptide repeat protein [Nitrospira sp.]|nr:tetratricopeptide repeat protein [Nitrospira sp.]